MNSNFYYQKYITKNYEGNINLYSILTYEKN